MGCGRDSKGIPTPRHSCATCSFPLLPMPAPPAPLGVEEQDTGCRVWIRAPGCSEDAKLWRPGAGSRSRRRPSHPTARLPTANQVAARAAAPISRGGSGSRSRRARSEPGVGAGSCAAADCERGESGAAGPGSPASPASPAAATFQPALGILPAVSQVPAPAPWSGRASVPRARGSAGGARGVGPTARS